MVTHKNCVWLIWCSYETGFGLVPMRGRKKEITPPQARITKPLALGLPLLRGGLANHAPTPMKLSLHALLTLALCTLATTVFAAPPKKVEVIDPNAPISFYKQVRPIFQGQCQGCHQPAKAKGGYIMTEFAAMLKGGKDGHAIIASKPEESNVIELITLKANS